MGTPYLNEIAIYFLMALALLVDIIQLKTAIKKYCSNSEYSIKNRFQK